MTQEELQQQIRFYYAKLPVEIQTIFSSMKWLETIKAVSATYSLSSEQQQSLGTETTLVMLGVINPTEYEDTVKNKMGIDKDVGDKIYLEINESVLKTIRSDLSNIFKKNTEVPSEENILTENGLDERFKKMPTVVRDAINESEYKAIIYAIAKDQNLTIGQTDRLELSTADLMLGTISNEKYVELVQTELRIPIEKAMSLVSTVNEKVLKKIRGIMMAPARAPKLENTEHAIMKSAGIEIVSNPPNPPNLTEMGEGKQSVVEIKEEVKEIAKETPAPMPIIGQKLAGSFQIESTKTEHTVSNLTPTTLASTPVDHKPEAPKAYPPKGDPYRLSPED